MATRHFSPDPDSTTFVNDTAAYLSTQWSRHLALPKKDPHRLRTLYEPLPTQKPHIRLLTVFGYSKDNVPICDLQPHALEDCSFTALSYAWGEPPATKLVQVNGTWRCIRSNLYVFLRQLAQEHYTPGTSRSTSFFIDALCINQRDSKEKESQVQLMGDVYRRAEKVVVWLPPSPNNITNWFSPGPQRLDDDIARLQSATAASAMGANQSHALQRRSAFLAAVSVAYAFTPSPYWTRLWILQEIILAQKLIIQLPSGAVDLELFEQAFSYIFPFQDKHRLDFFSDDLRIRSSYSAFALESGPLGGFGVQTLPLIALAWRRKAHRTGHFERQPLYELIAAFSGQQATVHHDMIYGMLGMASTHIVADYQAPLTDLFMHILIESLCAIKARRDREPDFRKFTNRHILFFCTGLMNVFNLSCMDLAAQIIVRQALALHAPPASRKHMSFRKLWARQLDLRPHPLLERSRWCKRIIRLHEKAMNLVDAAMTFFWPSFSRTVEWKGLSYLRYELLRMLLWVYTILDLKLSMPDGTTRTVAGWQKRVHEVGRLVKIRKRIPSQSPKTSQESVLVRNRSRNTKSIALNIASTGYILDFSLVVTMSCLTARLGVHLGDLVDVFVAKMVAAYGIQWPALLPQLGHLFYYSGFTFIALCVLFLGLMVLAYTVPLLVFGPIAALGALQGTGSIPWAKIKETIRKNSRRDG